MLLFMLYPIIFTEMLLILILLFRTPLRNLAVAGLSQLKHGRGNVVAQTLMGTLFVLLFSSLHGLFKVHKSFTDAAAINPTEQVLMAFHLLEATLLGISLFLALIVDRLHYYISELRRERKKLEGFQLHVKQGTEVHG